MEEGISSAERLPSLVRQAFEAGRGWFLNSGIQNDDRDSPFYGAIHAWYDVGRGAYSFGYPEVTGYAIRFLLYWNQLQPNPKYLARARAAAGWIERAALDPSTMEIRHKIHFPSSQKVSRFSYSFDNSIILGGFLSLYQETGEAHYLSLAREIASRLIDNMQSEEGYFFSHLDLVEGRKVSLPDKWSRQPSAHHAKIALSLLGLYQETGEGRFRESALKVCRWTARQQKPDGRFVSNDTDKSTLLHPHCYALEGLLYAGLCLEDSGFLESAVRGILWFFHSQLENGGIPAEFRDGGFTAEERGDSLAQTIRLVILAIEKGLISKEYVLPLKKLASRLLAFQCQEGPPAQKGGFHFLIDGKGRKLEHLNSWATMFAVQALEMLEKTLANKDGNDCRVLF